MADIYCLAVVCHQSMFVHNYVCGRQLPVHLSDITTCHSLRKLIASNSGRYMQIKSSLDRLQNFRFCFATQQPLYWHNASLTWQFNPLPWHVVMTMDSSEWLYVVELQYHSHNGNSHKVAIVISSPGIANYKKCLFLYFCFYQ